MQVRASIVLWAELSSGTATRTLRTLNRVDVVIYGLYAPLRGM